MIVYGLRRSVLVVLPARMSGSTGRTHGDREVMTPATNATPRRISTGKGYEAPSYERMNSD
jgi:hypothetical protein